MSLFCVAAPAVVGGKVTSGMIRISIEKFSYVDFIAEEIVFYQPLAAWSSERWNSLLLLGRLAFLQSS